MSKTKDEKLSILRDVVVISLAETSLWTGRSKMTAEDLGLREDQVPPEAVASLGSKRVIDPTALKPLNKIRYLMRRACREVGMRFLGGFAVATEESEAAIVKLDLLVDQGEALKKTFLAQLDAKIAEWHKANPRWQHIMRAGTPERERIGNKIAFGYHAIMVYSPENPRVGKSLLGAVDMMGSSLVEEVVSEARDFVKRSLTDGREQGSQKTVEPIRRLTKKIHSLRFIDPSLGAMAEVLKRVLQTVPDTGQVKAEAFLNLTRVANLLANRERFSETSHALHEGRTTVDDVVAMLTSCTDQPDILALESEASRPMTVADIFADETAPQIPQAEVEVLEVIAKFRETVNKAPQPQPVQSKPVKRAAIDF